MVPRKDKQGLKKPGKVYWLINLVLLSIAAVIFLFDVFFWRRFNLSLLWMLITAGVAIFSYVQYKSIEEKK